MVAAGVVDEHERVELIGGELVPMSPKGSRHEVVKKALNRRWMQRIPDDIDLIPKPPSGSARTPMLNRTSSSTPLEPRWSG
jgi:hypothetical protein